MNDQAIENEIKAKGLTAPRVTPADIEANIASEHYFTAGEGVIGAFAAGEFGSHSGDAVTLQRGSTSPEVLKPSLNLLTFCVLVLRNGFTVTGESACASPENFDAELGRKIARANAVNKVWPLIEANIASEHYFTAADGRAGAISCGDYVGRELPQADNKDLLPLKLLTFCVLVLKNGFTVTGESACASPENFDAELGRKISRANAVNKVWPLLGFSLKQKLHEAAK